MNSWDKTLTTACDCGDPSHIMSFKLYCRKGDAPELYLSVQLNQQYHLWKRLWIAAWYVLGAKSRYSYGHWDVGSISLESAKELIILLENYIGREKHG